MGRHTDIKTVEAWAKEYIESGLTQKEIAEKYGVCFATVSHSFHNRLPRFNPELFKKVMEETKFRGRGIKKLPKSLYISIGKAYIKNPDITYKQIGEELNIAEATVARIIKVGLRPIDEELWQKCLLKRKTRWRNI